ALARLKTTGECTINLTEPMFDHDYPGHHQRRLSQVGVTVVYPNREQFDNVKCTLTLASNSVRVTPDLTGGYRRPDRPATDLRFFDQIAATQQIVTSSAQDDSGLFSTDIE